MASKKKQKNSKKGLFIFLGVLLILVLFVIGAKAGRHASLSLPINFEPTPIPADVVVSGVPMYTETYKGTLPCADCSGLVTEITFSREQEYQGYGTYVEQDTYEGKSETPVVTKGKWTLQRGTPSDNNATVYSLEPEDGGQTTDYLKVDDNTIELLDSEENPIDSPFNTKLTKQPSTTMANPASVNCVEKGGKSEIRTDAQGNQYGMCIMSTGRECEEWAFFRDGTCKAY